MKAPLPIALLLCAAVCAGKTAVAEGDSPLTIRAGAEMSFYQDSKATTVASPTIFAGVEHVLGGWGVSGTLMVDVVSTASADIVATASTRWNEVRVAPALRGHRRFGDADVAVRAAVSSEPDYLSTAGGATLSLDLANKLVTPSLSYDFSHDLAGRTATPFSLFARPIDRHTLSGSVSLIMSRATVFVPALSATFERGDTSKPYRYIPLFSPNAAAQVVAGMSAEAINPLRIGLAPLEQLPTSRQRWSLDGLVLHRFAQSTLRFEERLYVDTWGLKASTADAHFQLDLSERTRLGAHLRFHAQTGVNFWRLAYVATATSAGIDVPALRAGGPELGPLFTPTEGLDLRIELSPHNHLAISFAGDLAETRFLDHLYLTGRTSFLGATTLDVEL
ncbi:MAG: DUF3570 domain-containing protein [Byssovorax sp.]